MGHGRSGQGGTDRKLGNAEIAGGSAPAKGGWGPKLRRAVPPMPAALAMVSGGSGCTSKPQVAASLAGTKVVKKLVDREANWGWDTNVVGTAADYVQRTQDRIC